MVAMNTPTPILLSPEQQEIWAHTNDSAADIPRTSVAAMFLERAAEDPQRPAVIAARRRLGYGELAARARALAAELLALDDDVHTPVAISVEPGWEQVAAVAGAMLAGLPFHPVDSRLSQPARWQRLADLGSSIVLTQSWLDERLRWPDSTRRISVDTYSNQSPDPIEPVGAERVACVLAGEGSASPLVPLTNDSLVNTIVDLNRRFDLGASDRLLAVSPLGDEISVYGIVGMLAAGAAIVIPDDIDLRTPATWMTLMEREAVTVWLSTPALAALLVEHLRQRGEGVPAGLRLAILAGEPLVPSLVQSLRDLSGRPLRVVNLGGALAAGLWSCAMEVGDLDARQKHVPIGVPLANQHVYVLSEAMAMCPVWVTGRLYFGGRGLAPAYWGKTPESETDFVTLPGSKERVYRSDQLGRLLPDGTIGVVGDEGSRVVVQGHPLNLRDVEGALAEHESVLTAVVVPSGAGSVAYAKQGPMTPATGAELLDFLRTKMSPYLLPDRIEPVAVLPLTPGGRIDRAALAAAVSVAPAEEAESAVSADDPELTKRACELAARVLGVPEVEPTMNLLDLGATSVQLVRLAVQAEQELGIQVDVEELLTFPAVTVLVSFPGAADAETADGEEVAPQEPAVIPAAAPSAPDSLILDPVDRMAFKDRQPGIRRDLDLDPGAGLSRPTDDRDLLVRRRTHRAFGPEPVTLEALSTLLATLRQFRSGVEPKYAYPSAGSLYPLQTYVSVAEGRVSGVAGGVYYYHPVRHRLTSLAAGVAVDAASHAWINRDAFRSSAFSLYLIARMEAITPMYGDRSRDYCLIEAGAMCQLLMTTAADIGVGLCPVGEMDFAQIRDNFRLDEQDEVLHIILGGTPPVDDAPEDGTKQTRMLARVDGLTLGTGDGERA